MRLLRRLPRAVLVTVLALLFFGGTTGIVAANGEPDLPATFGVPAPQQGDRWHYDTWATVRGPVEMEAPAERIHYEWLAPEALQDASGKWRVVHPLLEQNATGQQWGVYLLDAGGEVVAVRSTNESQGSIAFASFAGLGSSSVHHQEQTVTTSYEAFPTICGIRSGLQGQTIPTNRPVPFSGLCGLDDDLEDPEFPFATDGLLTARRIERLDGIPTLRFDGHDLHPLAAGTLGLDVRLWMSPTIPYPVRATYTFDFQVDLGTGTQRIEIEMGMQMLGFAPGKAWDAVDLPGDAAPPITKAPRQPWGPDDSGIDMPFRARDAWAAGKQHDEAAEWFEDNPDAQALQGRFDTMAFEDRVERTWTMLVAGGRDAAQLTVTQVTWNQEARQALAELTGSLLGPTLDVSLHEANLDTSVELPDRLPTVRSVQQRWASMGSDEPNAYGFEACGGCSGMDVLAGRVTGTDDAPAIADPTDPDQGTRTESRHMLRVDQDGFPRAIEESQEQTQRRGSVLQVGTPSVAAQAAPQIAGSMPSGWTFPSAPAAASVAAGAFLLGALYWLWPVLKSGGAMGLFSRIQRDEVLEHPVRRSIHEAVQANPGIHYQQLIRTVAKGRGTVEHHLRKLQAAGYIVSHRNAGHTCFFVKGSLDHSVMAAVPSIRTPAAARVLALIQSQPGLRSSDVASRLSLSRSTASHHVRRLKDAGLVEEAGGCLLPSALARPALAAVAA